MKSWRIIIPKYWGLVKKESPLTHTEAVASISTEALHILLELPKHFQWQAGALISFEPLEELQKKSKLKEIF